MGGYVQLGFTEQWGAELALEVGVQDGTESIVYIGRADLLYVPMQGVPFYLLGGLGGGIERFGKDDEEAGFLEIGGGYMLPVVEGQIVNLRVAYWIHTGSQNVQGTIALSAGYVF